MCTYDCIIVLCLCVCVCVVSGTRSDEFPATSEAFSDSFQHAQSGWAIPYHTQQCGHPAVQHQQGKNLTFLLFIYEGDHDSVAALAGNQYDLIVSAQL